MDAPSTPIDGIASPAPQPPDANGADEKLVQRWKVLISGAMGVTYAAYILWCLVLMMLLPSTSPNAPLLVNVGLVSMLAGAAGFLLISLISLLHIGRAHASPQSRNIALIKLGALMVPGLLLSGLTAYKIIGEPAYTIDILSPTTAEELVAPVAMSFSAETAVNALARKGFIPLRYRWDINGDAKTDSETFEPLIIATYDHAEIFSISVTMISASGETRIARKRIPITQAVFSVTPMTPIIDTPVVFDLSNLISNDVKILSADWDFDNDGTVDDTIAGPQASTIFYRTGKMTVTVNVQFSNNTRVSYQRVISVEEPPPLPFPVRIVSDPQHLVSTAPFTALFSIETDEQVANVQWQFGDGGRGEGMKVAHTFTRNGSYPVQAKVRTQSGTIADVSTAVSIVERLDLPDLRFEGSPAVSGGRIQGEVPLTVSLKPVTDKPFVTFVWEAPDATEIGTTKDSLQAIYRRAGRYKITLVGTDAENKVLRLPLTVDVRSPSAIVSFQMEPESGVAPLNVQFDASQSNIPDDDITGFIWGFGDLSQKEYGGAYTEHTFRTAGTYTIELTVRTAGGRQQIVTRSLVVRAPVIQACILPSRMQGTAPFGVEFSSACSTGDIRQVLWDFSDGSQSDERNPVHVFLSPGSYPVRLTVTDGAGSTHTASVTLTAQ